MNQHVVFSTPGLNPHDVYQSFSVVCKALLHPAAPASWKHVAACVLRFCVPTDDNIPWVFKGEESMQKFSCLLAPMAEAAVCKATVRPASTSAEVAESHEAGNNPMSPITTITFDLKTFKEEATGPAGKKRKRGTTIAKAKAKAKGKAGKSVSGADGQAQEVTSATTDGRATLVIDDLLNAVAYCLQDVSEKDQCVAAIESAYVSALTFIFTGSLDIPEGKPLKIWTKVRAFVKQQLTRRHSLRMRVSDPDSARVMAEVAGKDQGDDGDAAAEPPCEDAIFGADGDAGSPSLIETLTASPKLGQMVANFAAENSSSDALSEHHAFARVQVNFRKTMREILKDVGGKLATADAIIQGIVEGLRDCLAKEFDAEMIALAKQILRTAVRKDHLSHDDDDEAVYLASSTGSVSSTVLQNVVGVSAAAYAAWKTIGDVRAFLQLRPAYATAALGGVATFVQQTLTDSKGDASHAALLSEVKTAMESAVSLFHRLGGAKVPDELVSMDVASSNWSLTWSKLLHGAKSVTRPSFQPRTPAQWQTYKTEVTNKLLKKKVDELRKQAKPYLAKGEGGSTKTVEELDEQAGWARDCFSTVEQQLSNMKKDQLAELISDELVIDAKAEETVLIRQWSALVTDVTAAAKVSAQDKQLLDDEDLTGAVVSAIAAGLEPETEISFKEFRGKLPDGQPLFANFQQATGFQLMSCGHTWETLFQHEGLECVHLSIGGKPGNLKAKLVYRKPDSKPPPERVRFYFVGKVSSTLWDAACSPSAGGAKHRILLKCGSEGACDNDENKFGLILTPLSGMMSLQSPMWQPAWNAGSLDSSGFLSVSVCCRMFVRSKAVFDMRRYIRSSSVMSDVQYVHWFHHIGFHRFTMPSLV
eukprot:Skav231733  [mRNA]  locus=scaffold638:29046:32829:+ [translate_table: standard]